MTLEVRHLRLVTEIAATGSVTRAAERLHLTQSALSHQLRDLEERLATPIFTRLGRRMVLTPAGDRLLEVAGRVLDDLRRAEEDLGRIAQHGDRVLRVCAQCQTGYHWLPPLLTVFQRRHPGVEVSIVPDAGGEPLDALFDGRLDLAIMTDPPADARLVQRPLFRDEQVLLVGPAHRLASRTWIEPVDLEPEHLILYSTSRERSYTIRRILEPAGVAPARVSCVQLTEAIVELVSAGHGVSVLPSWTVEAALAAGRLRAVHVGRRGVFRQWSAVRLRAAAPPPWLDEFLDLLAARALPARTEARRPVKPRARLAG